MKLSAIAAAVGGTAVHAASLDNAERFVADMMKQTGSANQDLVENCTRRLKIIKAMLPVLPKYRGKKVLKPMIEQINTALKSIGFNGSASITLDYSKRKQLELYGFREDSNYGQKFGGIVDADGLFNPDEIIKRLEAQQDNALKALREASQGNTSPEDKKKALTAFFHSADTAAKALGISVDTFLRQCLQY